MLCQTIASMGGYNLLSTMVDVYNIDPSVTLIYSVQTI